MITKTEFGLWTYFINEIRVKTDFIRVASNNYDTETALVESFKMTPKLF